MLRIARALALICLAPLAAGCSSSDEPAGPSPLPGPEEWNREVTPPADADAAAARSACSYQRGALPAETQGASHPSGADIPIDHVIVVMMENRSFDHYFQKLPEYGQPDADVAPAGFTNPDPDGVPVGIFHETQYCFVDTAHSWSSIDAQIAGGAMSGFVTTSEGSHELPVGGSLEMLSGRRAMGYYDETDLPFYYWLANEFAIGDRYFSSVPGPTFPNRMYLYAGSSFGAVHNGIPDDTDIIVDYLEQRQIDWRVYASGTPGFMMFLSKINYVAEHVKPISQFYEDAAAGNLPQFAFVDPSVGLSTGEYDNNDEHPPALAQTGQRFVADVVQALALSPNWPRSALFLTYDEHGGLYDHVEPPPACPPDDIPPELKPGDPDKGFDRLGIRVPFIVVSPWAKRHHVSHEIYDHTSILRFIEARFVMPALSNRDANALAPWDMFDFTTAPDPTPPNVPVPEPPTAELAQCAAIFEGP